MVSETPINTRTLLEVCGGLLLLGAGIFAGLTMDNEEIPIFEPIREGQEEYTYINPLLFTRTSDENISSEYAPLREQVTDYVSEATDRGAITNASIYFRELNSDKWFDINPGDTFSPASMLKVLTLMATMREAELDSALLNMVVTIEGDDTSLRESQVRYPVQDPIRSGESYTVQTLINHLIIDSDNVANTALISLLGTEKINEVYEDLRLPKPDESTGNYTARQYSRLFRTLYNGTYLSHAVSEHVLELLSKTTFTAGLVKGVPAHTVVAHKYGIKTVLATATTPQYHELHDCGIIYFPQHPYFLCVMTRGNEYSSLETFISEISRIAWRETTALYTK